MNRMHQKTAHTHGQKAEGKIIDQKPQALPSDDKPTDHPLLAGKQSTLFPYTTLFRSNYLGEEKKHILYKDPHAPHGKRHADNAKQIINDTQQKTEPKRQEKQARLVGNCQHIHISGTPY